jgi:hypothetical protein
MACITAVGCKIHCLILRLHAAHSHLANTPLEMQASYCSIASSHVNAGHQAPAGAFPCGASLLKRVAYVLGHLPYSFKPCQDPLVLLTQLGMLLGVLLAVTDLLKVWPRCAKTGRTAVLITWQHSLFIGSLQGVVSCHAYSSLFCR